MIEILNNTVSIVVLKQDVNTVDVVHSPKIHLPPHGLVLTGWTYYPCSHARLRVSVHCITCFIFIGFTWLCWETR